MPDSNVTNMLSLSNSAIDRIENLKKEYGSDNILRITVSGGGCSGFKYSFDLDKISNVKSEDIALPSNQDILAVIDDVSLEYLKGSIVNFIDDLGGAYFRIENPNATATCGCGSSFAV